MTQESNDVAEIYKQINEAELQANTVENMLDRLDCKMEEILVNYNPEERPSSRQEHERGEKGAMDQKSMKN